jgi:hypothetical protein
MTPKNLTKICGPLSNKSDANKRRKKTCRIVGLAFVLVPLGACAGGPFQETGYNIVQGYLYNRCEDTVTNRCSEPPAFGDYMRARGGGC